MTVWVTYFYDVGPIVSGVFATEIEARRAAGASNFNHVIEVVLPCPDIEALIRRRA